MRKLVVAAGLKGLRPYDLRHTAITDILQDPDVSEETAKAIAGHISDKILKTYSHIRISAKRSALDALFKKRPGTVRSTQQGNLLKERLQQLKEDEHEP